MAITLPYTTQKLPRFRLHVSDTCTGESTPLPMAAPGRNGYEVRVLSRASMPDFGELIFQYKFGLIDGKQYGVVDDSLTNIGYADLIGKNVIVEASVDGGETWVVRWLGECIAQDENSWPGSANRAGVVTYHCRDLLHKLTKWQLARHVPYVSTLGDISPLALSYNSKPEDSVNVLGNKESSGALPSGYSYFFAHTQSGSEDAVPWTDLDVVRHAIDSAIQPESSVGVNDLVWGAGMVAGATDLLSGANFWKVEDQQTVFDLIRRVFNRRRGLGIAVMEFGETLDANGSVNSLQPVIKVYAQVIDDITYTAPSGGSVTINGAGTNGTSAPVDLIGDHRLVDGSFQIAAESETLYNAVVTTGDFIQVIISASTADYLDERWSSAEATAYDAAIANGDDPSEDDAKWGNVYSTVGFSYGWTFQAPDWSGTATTGQSFIDLSTSSDLSLGFNAGKRGSPLGFTLTDELPLAAGWNYTVNPAVKISGTQDGEPNRSPVRAFKRVNTSPERYVDAKTAYQLNVDRAGYNGNDLKCIGTTGPYFAAESDQDDHWFTLNIRLNNRIEASSGDLTGKVKRIRIDGLGLQLIHNGAIIGLDYDNPSNDGFPPLHGGTAAISVSAKNFYVVRDDRDRLARAHEIAKAWYTTVRRTARWGLNAFGFGSFALLEETTVDYPKIGHIVSDITYGGFVREMATPVTRIEYDHDRGVTEFVTSWSDRDWTV